MSENDDLRAALADLAESAPPALDLLGGVDRHRQARQRRRVAAAAGATFGAVALVAAGVVVTGGQGGSSLDTAAGTGGTPTTATQTAAVAPDPSPTGLPECSTLPAPTATGGVPGPIGGVATGPAGTILSTVAPDPTTGATGIVVSGGGEVATSSGVLSTSGEAGGVSLTPPEPADDISTSTVLGEVGAVASDSAEGDVSVAPPGTAVDVEPGVSVESGVLGPTGMAASGMVGTVVDPTSFRLAAGPDGIGPEPTFHITADTKVTRGGTPCHLTLETGQVVALSAELAAGEVTAPTTAPTSTSTPTSTPADAPPIPVIDIATPTDLDLATLELR